MRTPQAAPFGRQIRGGGNVRDTILSAALHVLVIGLLIWGGGKTFADATRGPGEDVGRGGGGGGGGVRAFMMLMPHGTGPAPTVPTPTPVAPPVVPPTVTPTSIPEPVAVAPPAPAPPAASTTGTGTGNGGGTGTGPGTGSGTGGGSGSGVGTGTGNDSGPGGGGGNVFPPQLQGIILPPPGRPGNMRGQQLVITFQINERGEVVDVSVDPAIKDRSYRNEFLDRMRRYTFTPAYTRDGHAIAASLQVTITL